MRMHAAGEWRSGPTIAAPYRPASGPPPPAAITGYTAKAVKGGATVVPVPLLWSSAAGRVAIAFSAASFADQPEGAYTFTAAATNADGTGAACSPGVQFTIL